MCSFITPAGKDDFITSPRSLYPSEPRIYVLLISTMYNMYKYVTAHLRELVREITRNQLVFLLTAVTATTGG